MGKKDTKDKYPVCLETIEDNKDKLFYCPSCGSNNLEFEFSGSQGYIKCNKCDPAGPRYLLFWRD